MTRWGFLIDLDLCIGCDACTVACKAENKTPPGIWYAPVFDAEVGKFPNAKRIFVPALCNHCKDAPCIKACPTGALFKRPDGIVLVDDNKCCGTRACMAACPYGALHFYDNPGGYFGEEHTPFEERAKWKLGTIQKCTYCVHRIDAGLKLGLKPGGEDGTGKGADSAATPACVVTCPVNCRIFGDLDDPKSTVSKLVRERTVLVPREECGTEPSTVYVLGERRGKE